TPTRSSAAWPRTTSCSWAISPRTTWTNNAPRPTRSCARRSTGCGSVSGNNAAEAMRVFVYEYTCAVGGDDGLLQREGTAMRDALAADFADSPGVQVVTLSRRVGRVFEAHQRRDAPPDPLVGLADSAHPTRSARIEHRLVTPATEQAEFLRLAGEADYSL